MVVPAPRATEAPCHQALEIVCELMVELSLGVQGQGSIW